ncbi:MAG: hypothetical protein ACOVN9_08355, partial [Inhella sp.]
RIQGQPQAQPDREPPTHQNAHRTLLFVNRMPCPYSRAQETSPPQRGDELHNGATHCALVRSIPPNRHFISSAQPCHAQRLEREFEGLDFLLPRAKKPAGNGV